MEVGARRLSASLEGLNICLALSVVNTKVMTEQGPRHFRGFAVCKGFAVSKNGENFVAFLYENRLLMLVSKVALVFMIIAGSGVNYVHCWHRRTGRHFTGGRKKFALKITICPENNNFP